MTFGQMIKKLRREKDMTQEQLAEILSISPQAVSRWETDAAMPDLSLLPAICNLFNVTSDALLGIDIENKEKKIDEIIDQAMALSHAGQRGEALAIYRAALVQYPASYKLMLRCGGELYHEFMTQGADPEVGREAAAYLDKILEGCTDIWIRNNAISYACRLYSKIGRMEDALSLADSMQRARSKLELMPGILRGKERHDAERDLICYYLNNGLMQICYLAYNKDENGAYCLSEAERLAVFDKTLAGLDLLYEDGDTNFMAQIQEVACMGKAAIYAGQKDVENTLNYVKMAAEYAKIFDSYDPKGLHTSIIPRGRVNGGVWKDDLHNRSYHLLSSLRESVDFDFVRETPEFREALNILESAAK